MASALSRPSLISRSAIDSGFSWTWVSTSGPTYSSRPSPSWRVVGVDLPGALGGVDHQAVLGVDALEQLVDRRVGDALGGLVDLSACHVRAFRTGAAKFNRSIVHSPRSRLPARRHTSWTDVLTSVTSNSCSAASSTLAAASRRSMHLGGLGAAAGEPAHQLLPGGRGQEDQLGLRHHALDLPRALEVDLQQDGHAGGEPASTRRARRAVAVARELGPLEQLPAGDQPVELVVVDEE